MLTPMPVSLVVMQKAVKRLISEARKLAALKQCSPFSEISPITANLHNLVALTGIGYEQ